MNVCNNNLRSGDILHDMSSRLVAEPGIVLARDIRWVWLSLWEGRGSWGSGGAGSGGERPLPLYLISSSPGSHNTRRLQRVSDCQGYVVTAVHKSLVQKRVIRGGQVEVMTAYLDQERRRNGLTGLLSWPRGWVTLLCTLLPPCRRLSPRPPALLRHLCGMSLA